jgi:NAD(P)-dependent dehydrogenase (short-subunit alcohol dehydrogenase family)
MAEFNTNQIPSMTGKTVLVTGGNSGIGYQIALVMAGKGAEVIIACRNPKNAETALAEIRKQFPNANVEAIALDLANLESVKSFPERFVLEKLDILFNNAGVMNIPKQTLTVDGFETHMGVNHLGHFALTCLLLPWLRKSAAPRVVCQSALVAYNGTLDFENMQSEMKYKPMGAYSQSKLCNVLFANELGRREAAIVCVAVQPGSAMTGLQRHTPKAFMGAASFLMKFAGQSVENCALPALYAATQADVQSGMFFGPVGKLNKGGAGQRKMPKRAEDTALAKKLWEVSERLTGVTVPQ